MDKEKIDQKIYQEQIKRAYANQLYPTLGSFTCAIILAIIQSSVIDKKTILGWITCVIAAYSIRWLMAVDYSRKKPDKNEIDKWGNKLLFGTTLVASVWGLASFLIFPLHSETHQVFLFITILGICAGAVTSLSSYSRSIISFLFIVLVPLIIQYFLGNTYLHTAMAIMITIYLGVLFYIARYTNKNITEVIKLQIKTKDQEDTLKNFEKRHEEFIENLPVGVFRCDFSDKDMFILANSPLVKLLGYQNKDELYKESISSIFKDSSEYKIFRVKMISNGKIKAEKLRLRKKDGNDISCEITARTVRNSEGKLEYFDGIILDVPGTNL